jgi:16S rRNA processing protein RimM
MRDSDLEIGVIGKPHGVRGDVHLWLHQRSSSILRGLTTLTIESPDEETQETWTIRKLREANRGALVLRVDALNSREDAQSRTGWRILFPKADLPALDPGEFYYHELLGLPVETPSGLKLGTIRQVIATGTEILEIERADGSELLVPVVEEYVMTIDAANGRVVVVEDLLSRYAEIL